MCCQPLRFDKYVQVFYSIWSALFYMDMTIWDSYFLYFLLSYIKLLTVVSKCIIIKLAQVLNYFLFSISLLVLLNRVPFPLQVFYVYGNESTTLELHISPSYLMFYRHLVPLQVCITRLSPLELCSNSIKNTRLIDYVTLQ